MFARKTLFARFASSARASASSSSSVRSCTFASSTSIGTPVFTGPGEARSSGLLNLGTRPITDREFEGHVAIGEWQFREDPQQRFAGVLDVFGDGSLWALHVPGHTPGSTAYLARTPKGPVLMAGDACHTAWGWENGVEPGSFSKDIEQSAHSLRTLKDLATRHPNLDVRLGHQAPGQKLAHLDSHQHAH